MVRTARRPRIAVTCDFENKTDSRGAQAPRFWLSTTYVETLNKAGADAYIVPHMPGIDGEGARALLAPMDGLVVSGGAFDIDPKLYGQVKHPSCGPLNAERTVFEGLLLQAAQDMQLPCLGICAGMQLMVVNHGGTLHQDLSLRPNTDVHEQPQDKVRPFHGVTCVEHSLLHRCSQGLQLQVNSTHHQIVDSPGKLVAVGHSPDGVIEAVENPRVPFFLGVQWHPEALADGSGLGLYQGLVETARRAISARRDGT